MGIYTQQPSLRIAFELDASTLRAPHFSACKVTDYYKSQDLPVVQ